MIIKRVGGKTKIAPWIVSYFNNCSIFVDCFGGSGAVLNKYKTQNNSCRYVYNDLDNKIYTFFKVIQNFPDDLSHLVNLTPYSRFIFNDAFDIISNKEKFNNLSDPEQALCFLIVNRQSFGSKMEKDWSITRDGEINYDTWNKLPEYIFKTYKIWKNVYLENLDYKILLKKWDSPTSLFYLDPPYEGVEQEYYDINKTGGFNHIEMFEEVISLKGSFYVSYYGDIEQNDSLLINKYKDFGCKIYRKEVTKHLSSQNKTKAIELLITNSHIKNKKISIYE